MTNASIRRPRFLRTAIWILLLILATGVGLVALRYLSGDVAVAPLALRENMAARLPFFLAHTIAGAVALLILPWQLLGPLRRTRRSLHRLLGRIYVAAVAVSGVSAIPIALGSSAGPVAASGFTGLALAWLFSTAMAFHAIRGGDVAAHRRWMLRSAVLTMAAITLRLYLPVAAALGFGFEESYPFIAWACWGPNLIAVELLIARSPARAVTA